MWEMYTIFCICVKYLKFNSTFFPPGTGGQPERCPVDSSEDGNPAGSKGEALWGQDQGEPANIVQATDIFNTLYELYISL